MAVIAIFGRASRLDEITGQAYISQKSEYTCIDLDLDSSFANTTLRTRPLS